MRSKLPRTGSLAAFLFVVYLFAQGILILHHERSVDATTVGAALRESLDFTYTGSSSFSKAGGLSVSLEDLPPIDLQAEVQRGRDYAKSFTNTKRKLVFVHIPKTAGTTIEEVGGLQAKEPWGSCLFNHRPRRKGGVCKYPPGQFEWPMKIGYWHLPTQVFPLMGVNPYENADLFAVVRDPYDRLLSEFYYICRRKVSKWHDEIDCNNTLVHEPAYMNQWIQQKLEPVLQHHDRMTPKDLLNYNGHFTPQYDFLVSRPAGIRIVDYVLRMDQLTHQFSRLMQAYDLPVSMSEHKKNVARNDTKDLDSSHFDARTWDLIHQIYGHDVEIMQKRDEQDGE